MLSINSVNQLAGLKFFNGSHDMTMPLSGRFIVRRLGLTMFNLPTKFEVSTFTHYEDTKGNAQCRSLGDFGWL